MQTRSGGLEEGHGHTQVVDVAAAGLRQSRRGGAGDTKHDGGWQLAAPYVCLTLQHLFRYYQYS